MGAIGTVSGARDTLSPGELLLKDFSAGGEKDLLLEKDDAEEAGHLREAPGADASGLWDWGVGGREPSGSGVPGEGKKME